MSHRVKKWSQVDWVESVGKGKALRRKGKKGVEMKKAVNSKCGHNEQQVYLETRSPQKVPRVERGRLVK